MGMRLDEETKPTKEKQFKLTTTLAPSQLLKAAKHLVAEETTPTKDKLKQLTTTLTPSQLLAASQIKRTSKPPRHKPIFIKENPAVKAAAAIMAERVFKSRFDELKKRDSIIEELQQQLQEAMTQVEAAKQASPPSSKKQLPSVRRRDKIRPRRMKAKNKGSTTFGGFTTQGVVPNRSTHPPSPPTQPSPQSRSLRHKFLVRSSQTIHSGISHPRSPTTKNEARQVAGRRTAQKARAKKLKKISSKYGRATGSDGHTFRKWSKHQREAKWSQMIDPENVVLQKLLQRIDAAAHGRMKPRMSSFEGAPLNRVEFKQISLVEFGVKMKKEEVDEIFQVFDRDSSQTVDYREVVHHLFSDLANQQSRTNLTMYI